MERIVEQSLLYDFYGELLTEHQQQIYEAAVFEDYSLSEIAKDEGISRQGVHDLLKRCNKSLEEYEKKLHLVEKFKKVKQSVEGIQKKAEVFKETREVALIDEIEGISREILEEL
ncbi:MAG: YlxM family DNA-binding protein [Lachnospiraceae bacterium]|nr:YlxM family DNA-binding protein [Lachnospiraceae bacterium]